MSPQTRRLVSTIAAGVLIARALAQTSPTPAGQPAGAEGVGSPDTPPRAHAVSPDLAAKLSLDAPKFIPPEVVAASSPVAPPELEKPKNQIVRLPNYLVREPKAPVFRERDLYTKKGLADLAMRRYLTETYRVLNPFTLPLFGTPPEARALARYAKDERLQNIGEMNDLAELYRYSDPKKTTAVKQDIEEASVRTSSR